MIFTVCVWIKILLVFFALPAFAQEGKCIVTKITDGDTFQCISDGSEIVVRLIGIDTPELPTPEGESAKKFTDGMMPLGTVVRLELDIQVLDRYRRVLAYVWLPDGTMLNEVLLRRGVAQLMTIPPNVKYVDRFIAVTADKKR